MFSVKNYTYSFLNIHILYNVYIVYCIRSVLPIAYSQYTHTENDLTKEKEMRNRKTEEKN